MIATSQDIITRCEALAAGGWHPLDVCLSWWSDSGWQIRIEMSDWIGFGAPADELPQCLDLPIPYEVHPSAPDLSDDLPQGVVVLGGSKAPAYVEELRAAESWSEQAEAIIADLWRRADGDQAGPDNGYIDLRCTPYNSRHRWYRCRVWCWQTEGNKELRERADSRQVDRLLELLPTPADPVRINGRRMSVLRPCGCITHHHQAPGRGGRFAPSKLRFGLWLSQRQCLACQAAG